MADLTGIVVGVAALTTAAAGGVYLGFSTMVMPSLRGASPDDAVGTMNRINVFAVRSVFMVAFLGSLLASVLAAILVLGSFPGLDAVLTLVGAVLAIVAFLVTAAVNVPLNNRLAATTDGRAYAGFEQRWARANTVRGTLSLLGAASFIGALVV
jgi:uncharacterized membrane protein